MRELYTANDLVRHLYHETSERERIQLDHLIHHHEEASTAFELFSEMKTALDGSGLDPHPTSIQLIMEESRRTSPQVLPL